MAISETLSETDKYITDNSTTMVIDDFNTIIFNNYPNLACHVIYVVGGLKIGEDAVKNKMKNSNNNGISLKKWKNAFSTLKKGLIKTSIDNVIDTQPFQDKLNKFMTDDYQPTDSALNSNLLNVKDISAEVVKPSKSISTMNDIIDKIRNIVKMIENKIRDPVEAVDINTRRSLLSSFKNLATYFIPKKLHST